MAKIAFLMFPEPGHLLPTLGLAESLRQRGHSVCYYTTAEFRELIQRAGFEYRPMFSSLRLDPGSGDSFAVGNTGAQFMRRIVDRLLAAKQSGRAGLLNLVLSEMRGADFDLLVCDVVVFGFYLGDSLVRELRKPVVSLNVCMPEDDDQTSLAELVLCPRELEVPGETGQVPKRHYGEPAVCRKRPPAAFPWSSLDSNKPLVYCCFGTQLRNYPGAGAVLSSVMESFRHLPAFQLVVTTGNLPPEDYCASPPPNVLMLPSAPQLELLSRARSIVTHGGLGSIRESILIGVPMLVIPFHVDQPRNALRIQHHKLGAACAPSECSPEKIAGLIRELIDNPAIQANVDAMKAVFRAREAEAPIAEMLCCMAA